MRHGIAETLALLAQAGANIFRQTILQLLNTRLRAMDARLRVLLFLYVGVIGLYHAFDDRRLAGRAAGILVLVGVVNLPIIHYSVEWWNTLHQGSTNMQKTIDPSMRMPLRLTIFGFLFLFITLTLMRMRNLILLQERRRPWVVALAGASKREENS